MKRASVAALLFAGATACVSFGVQMEADALARIKPGVTTRVLLYEWFGPPQAQTLDTDGTLVLTWHYAKAGTTLKQQILSVQFDAHDVVKKYTLMDDYHKLYVPPPPPAPAPEGTRP